MEKNLGKLLLLLIFISVLGCEENIQKTGTLLDFVPENTSVVLKISNWEGFQADIENNSLFSSFNKTAPFLFLSEEAPLLKNLHPSSSSLLCFNDSLFHYTFISRETPNLFLPDSLKDKTIETLDIDNQTLQRITIGKIIAYSTIVDSIFVASSSQKILMNILKGKTEREEGFKKIFGLPASGELTAILRNNEMKLGDSTSIVFSSWTSMDLKIAPESLSATGITLVQDTIPQLLKVFEGQVPQQNNLADITPTDALSSMSFTFDDSERLQKNLGEFRREKMEIVATGIFGSANEVGAISLKIGTVVFIKSIDATLTEDAMARFVTTEDSFRGVDIKSFSEPELFRKTFYPLISANNAQFVFQLDRFFVFTESKAAAQEFIASFQNNTTLRNTGYFEKTIQDLGSTSSLLIYKMNGESADLISNFLNLRMAKNPNDNSNALYPLSALQFSWDRNFAHVTLSSKEQDSGSRNTSNTVSEKFNTSLENTILGTPHIYGENGNVVVQDIGNKLYYLSENGKIVWTKNLDAPILGEIEEVDFFGKGQKQMAFATKNKVFVLDRNGKDVNSFPLIFKDEITQPLSVFDYDNNRNYRFMIVQGKEVLLYNKEGKTVKGFNFSRAKSTIVQPPAHFRLGNKDYIVIAEENGTLNILSRVGKSRIQVSKKFNFSDIPIAVEDNTFVVITKENTKERISESGQVSSQTLNVGSSYWFTINGNTKVTLDDNLLRIDGKLAELPLGLYSRPHIFDFHQKTYVAISEIQEKKVYVFDRSGNLLNGFPVFGTSEAYIASSGTKKEIVLAVKGDPSVVIVYNLD